MTAENPKRASVPASAAPPLVLVCAGHDPSGAAGLQADVEAIAALGARAVSLVTALTAQSTAELVRVQPQEPGAFTEQAEVLLRDVRPLYWKIGLVPTPGLARAIRELLDRRAPAGVVLDPVLASGTGAALAGAGTLDTLLEQLVPRCTLMTPNSLEARRLTGEADLDRAARRLLELGAQHVLVTGTHESGATVINVLYGPAGRMTAYEWERLPHDYHGSGCTLAAAAAALLARGMEVEPAVRLAQQYTWEALASGYRVGQAQHHPDRFYAARKHEKSS